MNNILRFLFFSVLLLSAFRPFAQTTVLQHDSLLIIQKNPEKGFNNNYILFIPKGTPLHKQVVLLVEPNNTGKLSDSMEVHQQYAIDLASVSSVGNNVSTELHIPLLVPVFPRPESQPLIYTHALDKDVMVDESPELKRLDLQLLAMIADARNVLNGLNIPIAPKFFMNGFSASGSFTNRFSFIHPETLKALAIGGFNGELMLPLSKWNGKKLNYPLGTNDFYELFTSHFNSDSFRAIPQLIYMGQLDQNDAVQFDDAYDENERKLINENFGKEVQERYLKCQQIYRENKLNPIFRTHEKVGHWTTPAMNLEVIQFFQGQMQRK